LEDQFNLDYDVGRNFVEEIVPFSLELYLGIKPSFDHDDEDFEDEDEEEDDDEDDEDDGKKKKKGKKVIYYL
jgi:nucleosome assembly protein 1-like 1